jgi:hypothetical protein
MMLIRHNFYDLLAWDRLAVAVCALTTMTLELAAGSGTDVGRWETR